ncbi:MAG TPA: DUF1656 domain-containing protein [Aliidongia sp.]|nr:DUF1656 domain-containing protein [Aliidongia sp.]
MRYEDMDLFGVYMTPFLPVLAAAAALCFPLLRAADRLGIARYAWHPALFNTALYAIVLSFIVLANGACGL